MGSKGIGVLTILFSTGLWANSTANETVPAHGALKAGAEQIQTGGAAKAGVQTRPSAAENSYRHICLSGGAVFARTGEKLQAMKISDDGIVRFDPDRTEASQDIQDEMADMYAQSFDSLLRDALNKSNGLHGLQGLGNFLVRQKSREENRAPVVMTLVTRSNPFCPPCNRFKKETLPAIAAEFGGSILVKSYDSNSLEGRQILGTSAVPYIQIEQADTQLFAQAGFRSASDLGPYLSATTLRDWARQHPKSGRVLSACSKAAAPETLPDNSKPPALPTGTKAVEGSSALAFDSKQMWGWAYDKSGKRMFVALSIMKRKGTLVAGTDGSYTLAPETSKQLTELYKKHHDGFKGEAAQAVGDYIQAQGVDRKLIEHSEVASASPQAAIAATFSRNTSASSPSEGSLAFIGMRPTARALWNTPIPQSKSSPTLREVYAHRDYADPGVAYGGFRGGPLRRMDQMDSNGPTVAHETAHGINSRLRQDHNGKVGFFIPGTLTDGTARGVLLADTRATGSDVAQYVPPSFRHPTTGGVHRYQTYLQTPDRPKSAFYMFDEWVAYVIGAQAAREMEQSGQDAGGSYFQGPDELMMFSLAALMAIQQRDPNYSDFAQAKAFFKFLCDKTVERINGEGTALIRRLMNDSSPEGLAMKEFLKREFNAEWVYDVFRVS